MTHYSDVDLTMERKYNVISNHTQGDKYFVVLVLLTECASDSTIRIIEMKSYPLANFLLYDYLYYLHYCYPHRSAFLG